MPSFKDENVLIIAPGSQITQTQLGLPETFTPPRWRFPTRMFPGLNPDQWEPVYIRERTKPKSLPSESQTNGTTANGESKDVEMSDVPVTDPISTVTNDTTTAQISSTTQEGTSMETLPTDSTVAVQPSEPQADTTVVEPEEETEYYDDPLTIANAVYPMKSGRIENWPCFFALLSHIYKMISPPFHMPVLVVSQPCWTARDKEWITQYFFENWKIPALCVMDSALAATWGFGVQSACVVDVGLDKCDVSAVTDYVVNEVGRGVAIEGCGGNGMTTRLAEEMQRHKENYAGVSDLMELAEQLKKSPFCEILPAGVPLPGQASPVEKEEPNPAALASASHEPRDFVNNPTSTKKEKIDGDGENGDEEDEGVLDVAAIVAQNNAAEVLAKREREKAERDAKKKGGAAEAPKQQRLRNSEKEKTIFAFEEFVSPEQSSSNSDAQPSTYGRKRKRELEIGLERFMAATPSTGYNDGILDRIANAVHSTIMAVPDVPARAALWDNLIILGNGSRVRGFTSALVQTLSSRYTLSPSTATIFTSELPSNFSTPVPTGGTNTPIPGQHSHGSGHVGSGVNPLLVAATKNMMQPGVGQHLQIPGHHLQQHQLPSMDHHSHHSYRGYTQTPTSMRTVKAPEYFPEWKDPSVAGMEDAAFLGAQVAAKVVFIVDQGASKGFLTRPEYNEMGPEAIHSCAM